MHGAILVLCASALQLPAGETSAPGPGARAHAALQRLPLRFEPNVGQADPGVRFLARGAAPVVGITDAGAVLAGGLALQLVGARPHPRVSVHEPLPGRSHYFRGADPRAWRTDVPQFAVVRYATVYPGIDLVFHGAGSTLEYDFELAPGANPSLIRLRLRGAERATLDAAGNLIVRGPAGELVHRAPVAYQENGGKRVTVPARFTLRGSDVRFVVGPYDKRRRLVIDPVLSYSSYFGGNGDESVVSIGYDRDGNMILAGQTNSTIFPLSNPLQPTLGGVTDAFVAKLGTDGTTLLYSTYLGGSGYDAIGGLAVDAFGNAVVAGHTRSANFPVVNALQPTHAGGDWDAFVAKLSPSGSALAFSTYLGGSDFDFGSAVATDRAGNVYLTGLTLSVDFPLQDPIQPASGGAQEFYVAKLDALGSRLVYSTYLGGTQSDFPFGIGVDGGGRAVVVGFTLGTDFPTVNALQPQSAGGDDAVIAKLQADGRSLVYSTYLGGSHHERGHAVVVDAAGNVYVVGTTMSADFPLLNPAQATFGGWEDTFVAKINPGGSALLYSTFVGGLDLDRPDTVTVDESGSAYFGGETDSRNFPVVNALQASHGGGRYDGFAVRLSSSGSQFLWSTYLGGFGDDAVNCLSAGRTGELALGGFTASPNWPVVRPLQAQSDGSWEGFVARISAAALTPLALVTDSVPGPSSDVNAVLDPGETAAVIAGWRYNGTVPLVLNGQVTAFSGPGPATYSVVDGSATYGLVPGGGLIDCYNGTGDCYLVSVEAPQGRPVPHWDATLSEFLSGGVTRDWVVHVGSSFSDVARSSPYYRFVETLMHRGITAGCAGGQYCPGAATAREQMAVFVLVAQDGSATPPACVAGQEMFADLPATNPSCPFVEELARRGVVAGCGNGNFCPGQGVSREQMAVFTLATREGPTFRPPACVAGAERFGDVPAASPFCAWIEELAVRGVVTGCGGGLYCPTASVTREQMGVFITATFRLSLYTP